MRTPHIQLAAMGRFVGILFFFLAGVLLPAAIAWFRRRYWGWLLVVAIIGVNLVGGAGNLLLGERLKGVVGILIAGSLLYYLTRAPVREFFLRG